MSGLPNFSLVLVSSSTTINNSWTDPVTSNSPWSPLWSIEFSGGAVKLGPESKGLSPFGCSQMWRDPGTPTDSFYEVRTDCNDVPRTRFKIKVWISVNLFPFQDQNLKLDRENHLLGWCWIFFSIDLNCIMLFVWEWERNWHPIGIASEAQGGRRRVKKNWNFLPLFNAKSRTSRNWASVIASLQLI